QVPDPAVFAMLAPRNGVVAEIVQEDLRPGAGVVGHVADEALPVVGPAPHALFHLHDPHRAHPRPKCDELPAPTDELPPAALLPGGREHEIAVEGTVLLLERGARLLPDADQQLAHGAEILAEIVCRRDPGAEPLPKLRV